MYTIKRAAALTGVPEATLRAWERRYGVISPQRSDTGYRLYDDDALSCIRRMQALLASGWSPKQAAARLAQSASSAPTPETDASIERFLSSAARMDAAGLDRVLRAVFAETDFETATDRWLLPALRAIGEQWYAGELSIASEHLAAQAIMRRLTFEYESAGDQAGGPRVVVGLGPGSRHELGLLAFATAARRAGLDVLYLGGDLPPAEWCDAVDRHQAVGAVLAVPLPVDAEGTDAVIAALRAARPDLWVGVGGTYQDAVTPDAVRLGHGIAAGARRLADDLSPRPTRRPA